MPILTADDVINQSSFKTNIFVETGSCHGDAIASVANIFDTIYSIELSYDLYMHCVNRFKDQSHIKLINGASEDKLLELCPRLDKPVFFWLDAHWSGGFTARGAVDVPLLDELRIIVNNCKPKCIIAIDDVRLFGTNRNEDWSKITMDAVMEILSPRIIGEIKAIDSHIAHGDVCFITLKEIN
jgi:hypothetical protein